MVINPTWMDKVELGRSLLQSSALVGAKLNRVLSHLTLSYLTDMELNTSTIDPGVLSDFITRHPKLTTIRYWPKSAEGSPTLEIIPPPIVPSLETLASNNIVALMGAFSHCEPDELSFNLPFDEPLLWYQSTSTALWKKLSTRTKRLKLHISLWFAHGEICADDIEGAKLLHCVHLVKLEGRVEEASKFQGWLRALPALQRLQVRASEGAEWRSFYKEAYSVLGVSVERVGHAVNERNEDDDIASISSGDSSRTLLARTPRKSQKVGCCSKDSREYGF
ncbi:hypothetical protein B0H16DRAFT_1452589 [Mycena metata]|uniref:Uncharacterized protein n=1 Tax=Mycena metata TaxID=1033252 RepID=A0AAD7JRS2_9AGAR|nr:hypothetical protein B0H16DRAFT_1452589 [Mycena metata]